MFEHSRKMRSFSGPRPAVQLPDDPFGAQADGREWIFDFVRDAAGDFMPRGGLLRAQHVAGVFQNEHESRRDPVIQRRYRHGQDGAPCCSSRISSWLAATLIRRARFIR